MNFSFYILVPAVGRSQGAIDLAIGVVLDPSLMMIYFCSSLEICIEETFPTTTLFLDPEWRLES